MSFHEDFSLSGMPRLPDVCAQRKPSRCFRTTADGRIPLTQDWLTLLTAARSLGRVAIQTRHAYARLVAFREVPEFFVCPEHGYVQALDGSLRLHFGRWHRAWGRLVECDCCGTPGRMEVHNAHGLEFLQICPIPGCEPAEWARFLETAAMDHATIMDVSAADRRAEMAFPRLAAGARLLSNNAEDVVPLLLAPGGNGVAVRCALRTAEALHSRGLMTSHVDVTDGVLTAGEKGARFQIGLSAVRALALSTSAHGETLHFTGPGDTSLLTLTASAEADSQEAWRAALQEAFPKIN
jgi:hypothetical protein